MLPGSSGLSWWTTFNLFTRRSVLQAMQTTIPDVEINIGQPSHSLPGNPRAMTYQAALKRKPSSLMPDNYRSIIPFARQR
jgi:hypothetical protein